MDITKVIIPAATTGNRFLPCTKVIPQEMLPLGEKPALHYLVEEAIQSSTNTIVMVTNRDKHVLEDYFDASPALLSYLKENGQEGLLHEIEKILRTAQFSYIRQAEPLGLGYTIWLARHLIQKEYFGIMLPEDIIISKQAALGQIIRIARQEKASVIAVQEVPVECISSYPMIGIKKQITPGLFQISHINNKPDPKDAPSNLAVVGRFVLSSKIFNALEEMTTYSVGEELQLTDAINNMLHNSEKVLAYKVQGTRYDISTPAGWVKAVIGLALQNPHYGSAIKRFIQEMETPDSFLYNSGKNIEHRSL